MVSPLRKLSGNFFWDADENKGSDSFLKTGLSPVSRKLPESARIVQNWKTRLNIK